MLKMLERSCEAIDSFLECIKLNPNYVGIWYNLSKMYERFFCRGTVVRNINGVPVEHYWIRRNKNGEPIEIEESVIPFKD